MSIQSKKSWQKAIECLKLIFSKISFGEKDQAFSRFLGIIDQDKFEDFSKRVHY